MALDNDTATAECERDDYTGAFCDADCGCAPPELRSLVMGGQGRDEDETLRDGLQFGVLVGAACGAVVASLAWGAALWVLS